MNNIINLDNVSDSAKRLFVANLPALTNEALAKYVGHPSNPAFVALVAEKAKRGLSTDWIK